MMGALRQVFPFWGGALGKLVTGLRQIAHAVDNTHSADDALEIAHGADGSMAISIDRSKLAKGYLENVEVSALLTGVGLTITVAVTAGGVTRTSSTTIPVTSCEES